MTTRHSGPFPARMGARLGHTVLYEPEVDSTNRVAKRCATEGAAAGTVVVADFQTAGRGRHGRQWESLRGQNILMSIVLRPEEPVSHWGRYVMMAGLAVCRAIDRLGSAAHVSMKWPNDVLVDGRKCGGILMEYAQGALVLGLGLNVNQDNFPEENRVSLALVLGRPVNRGRLFDAVLGEMEGAMALAAPDLVSAYAARLSHAGRQITICSMEGRQPVTGTFAGVTPEGALRLLVEGREETFHAGDVTMAAP